MPQYVLGINLSHDRSSCLLRDGEIAFAIAEERLDRIKHSIGRMLHDHGRRLGPKVLPWRGMTYCLDAEGLSLDQVDLIMIDQAGAPVDLETIRREIPLQDKSRIQSIPHPSHHWAHAYSTYFASPFEESAILVADNIGSYIDINDANEGETGYHAEGTEVRQIFKTISHARDLESSSLCLGRLYRMVTLVLGFAAEKIARGQLGYTIQILDDAGKTMGLAPYGRPKKNWPPFVILNGEEPTYPHFIQWLIDEKLLKKRVQDGVQILELQAMDSRKSLSRYQRDLAYKVQDELEQGMVFLANKLYRATGVKNLCIGGGVGLNSVANYKILKQTPFENIFIQPAATDDGTALGAAYYGWIHHLGGKIRSPMSHAYLGREYEKQEIYKALFDAGIFEFEEYDFTELVEKVAYWISEGKIVGWFQGRSEFGPRALGARSILADPRNSKMKDILNQRVKFRESFRPYAPSILVEETENYFEIDRDSPFMLLVPPVRREKRRLIPAVTHVDGTARLQTVRRESHPVYYDLIAAFQKQTGIPILLNTSFNIKGMPIVETPADAVSCFKKTDLDVLVMNGIVVHKNFYSDEVLMALVPIQSVKLNYETAQKKPKAYWSDLIAQELHTLDPIEEVFLKACDGTARVGDIIRRLNKKKISPNFVRKVFRKGLIHFQNPFQMVP